MNVIEGQIQYDGSVLGPEQTLNQSIKPGDQGVPLGGQTRISNCWLGGYCRPRIAATL